MIRILIVGGNGFIGKNIKEYLETKENYLIDTPSKEKLNVLDELSIYQYLSEGNYDFVIHAAAPNGKQENMLKNILLAFFNFEKYSNLFGTMLYFGSGAEYNKQFPIIKVNEDEIGQAIPVDAYGFGKYIISRQIEKSNNIINLRLFGVFGKYERGNNKFISNICKKAVKNFPLTIRQNVFFDYLYVDDLCQLIEWFLVHKPKFKTYNVVRGKRINLYSLAEIVNQVSGKNLPITLEKNGLNLEYTAANDRLIKEIPDFIYTSEEKAIKMLYEYYLQHEKEIDVHDLI